MWTAPSSRGTSWTGVRTDTSMKSFQRDASSDMQQVYGKCSCTERFAEDVTLSPSHFASHLRNEMGWDDLTGEMTGAVTGKMSAVYVMVLTIYRFSRFCAAIMTFLWNFWEKMLDQNGEEVHVVDYDWMAAESFDECMGLKFREAAWGNIGIATNDLEELGVTMQKSYKSMSGETVKPGDGWESLCIFVYEKLTGEQHPGIKAIGRGFRSRQAGLPIANFLLKRAGKEPVEL